MALGDIFSMLFDCWVLIQNIFHGDIYLHTNVEPVSEHTEYTIARSSQIECSLIRSPPTGSEFLSYRKYFLLRSFHNLRFISMLSVHNCNCRSSSAPNRSSLHFFFNAMLHWKAPRITRTSTSGATWHRQPRWSHRNLRCQRLQCGLSDDRVGSG